MSESVTVTPPADKFQSRDELNDYIEHQTATAIEKALGPGAVRVERRVPWATSGPVGRDSAGYSVLKAAAFALGYRKLTPAGLKVCDPSGFVVFSLRWFNAAGYAPNGLHYDQLAAMWTAAGGKALPASPFPAPTPAPVPSWWTEIAAFLKWLLSLLNPLSHSVEVKQTFARRGISPGGILSWVTLILTEYAKVEPIIAADLAAGKTYLQILEDCLAALVPVPAAA
jgi:hypothetical protein